MGHFSILLPDAVGTMVADEPPEDLFEAGWLFLRDLADRIEDVSESDEEAGEHWRMLTEVWRLSGRGIEIASQRIGLSLRRNLRGHQKLMAPPPGIRHDLVGGLEVWNLEFGTLEFGTLEHVYFSIYCYWIIPSQLPTCQLPTSNLIQLTNILGWNSPNRQPVTCLMWDENSSSRAAVGDRPGGMDAKLNPTLDIRQPTLTHSYYILGTSRKTRGKFNWIGTIQGVTGISYRLHSGSLRWLWLWYALISF